MIQPALAAARAAQPDWAALPIARRIAAIRAARRAIAADPLTLARTAARPGMSLADILVAEILPLLAAMRFLERRAARVLADRTPGGRPLWLLGTRLVIRRRPFGVVQVVGPANYPLFLPGVQAVQALAAGNAVLVKPAPGAGAPMHALAALLHDAGVPPPLFGALPEACGIVAGVDKVLLTGSAETGRAVAATLAATVTPSVMELSGHDPVIVLPGADLGVAAAAISFGLGLNAAATCIAPRRIIAVGAVADALAAPLHAALTAAPACPLRPDMAARITAILAAAGPALGDRAAFGAAAMRPLVLRVPAAAMHLLPPDLGIPLAVLAEATDTEQALALANAEPHVLGAAVFGPPAAARACARALRAGCVTVNDLIAPTADPRLPFGGAGMSGHGVTRGAEGLLELTRPQAVVIRARPTTRHLRRLTDAATPRIARLLRLFYGR